MMLGVIICLKLAGQHTAAHAALDFLMHVFVPEAEAA